MIPPPPPRSNQFSHYQAPPPVSMAMQPPPPRMFGPPGQQVQYVCVRACVCVLSVFGVFICCEILSVQLVVIGVIKFPKGLYTLFMYNVL